MDIISTIYKELFFVKLLHKAYALPGGSEIFSQLTVTPDADTLQLLNRFNIEYRCFNDTISFYIRSQLVAPPASEPKIPFVKLDDVFKIRLLLTASPSFLGNTFVTAAGSKVVYHFTNKINNVQNTNRYINKNLEAYNAGLSYDAGTIVLSSGEPFVTLQPVKAEDNIAIGNTAYWKKVLPLEPVVNNADLEDTLLVRPQQPCFAVIDVYNTGTTNATYNLFNGSGHLLSPMYVITFKSKV